MFFSQKFRLNFDAVYGSPKLFLMHEIGVKRELEFRLNNCVIFCLFFCLFFFLFGLIRSTIFLKDLLSL